MCVCVSVAIRKERLEERGAPVQRRENETCVRRVGKAERDGGGRGFGYLRVGVNVLCSGSKAYASTAVRGFVPNGWIA